MNRAALVKAMIERLNATEQENGIIVIPPEHPSLEDETKIVIQYAHKEPTSPVLVLVPTTTSWDRSIPEIKPLQSEFPAGWNSHQDYLSIKSRKRK